MAVDTSTGLHRVSDAELERLLRAVFRDELPAPISRRGILLAWQHLEAHLEGLIGQSKKAAVAILGAVLRERRSRPQNHAKLVWMGPAPTGTGALAPHALIMELIANAQRSVLFAGAELGRDTMLLRALHAAQRGRELRVRVILQAGMSERVQLLEAARAQFRESRPWPELYVLDLAQVLAPLPTCVVVDGARALLVAGAAVVVEPDDRELAAGVLVEEPALAELLEQQWEMLIETDAVLQLLAADAG